MSFLPKRKLTLDELEEKKERVTIEEEILTKEAESAEREAVISELRKKYGKGWKKLLGAGKLTDLSTLRSFLKGAKQGMEKHTAREGSTPVSRMCGFQGVKRA